MEKPKLRALLLAAAVVAPNFVAPAMEQQAPIKHAEELSADEIRLTLRAMNGTVWSSARSPSRKASKNGPEQK